MTVKKILIVDDDQDFRRGLVIRLSASGYKVVFADDAISAVSIARKEEPDLIILDIGLPGGDGFAVMERLSSLGTLASIPVIVLTGRDPFTNRDRALAAGARAFLQKPADNAMLLEAIRQALEESTPGIPGKGHGQGDGSAAKILVVDDDLDFRRGLMIRLSASGFRVVSASDGVSAISTARKELPDLIILDIGLPGGDGFTVLERMSSLSGLATIPVIVLTGRDPFPNKDHALAAGARAFLQKPADNDVLLETIRKALTKSAVPS